MHQLITYVRRQFGEHLCSFLLGGYDEDQQVGHRSYAAAMPGEGGAERRRYLEVIADGGDILPYGDDALLLCALLKLLMEEGEPGSVIFRLADLRQLSPRGVAWHWDAVEAALARHYNTSYAEVRKPRRAAKRRLDVIKKGRLVTKYEFEQLENEDAEKIYIDVTFNVDYVEQLKQRSLFGIDWNEVTSLTRLPSE